MIPNLEKSLKKITPESMVTNAEAELLKELDKMRLKGDISYLGHLIEYCNAKLCR